MKQVSISPIHSQYQIACILTNPASHSSLFGHSMCDSFALSLATTAFNSIIDTLLKRFMNSAITIATTVKAITTASATPLISL